MNVWINTLKWVNSQSNSELYNSKKLNECSAFCFKLINLSTEKKFQFYQIVNKFS